MNKLRLKAGQPCLPKAGAKLTSLAENQMFLLLQVGDTLRWLCSFQSGYSTGEVSSRLLGRVGTYLQTVGIRVAKRRGLFDTNNGPSARAAIVPGTLVSTANLPTGSND